MQLGRELPEDVMPPQELELVRAAGLVHDMCRTQPQHARAAAEALRTLGYLRLAQAVESHHDAPDSAGVGAGKLLFLADKLVSGDREATLSERFELSLKKCTTPEALAAHEKRRQAALAIYDEFLKTARSAM